MCGACGSPARRELQALLPTIGETFPPLAGEYKRIERLPFPGRQFGFLQVIGQSVRLARITNRNSSNRLKSLWNLENLPRLLRQNSPHLVHRQAQLLRL